MNETKLSRDNLFHNRISEMSYEQQFKFNIMIGINHIVNCALINDRERSTGRCNPMQLSEFLKKIKKSFRNTIEQTTKCGTKILFFDDFIRIAEYSYPAIREIVNSPSTSLEKIQTKVEVQKARELGTRTMRWMAQRPGKTFAEKISPENKVLTSKTIFTTDTKENREFMYLYKIIHEAISSRLSSTKCDKNCTEQSCCYRNWIRDIKKLSALNSKIRLSELNSIKPIKQSYQNNKCPGQV